MESVLTLKTGITSAEGDGMKAISLQFQNQSTVKLFNQNLFIYIQSCLLSFKQSRLVYPLKKMMDLLVLTVQNSILCSV